MLQIFALKTPQAQLVPGSQHYRGETKEPANLLSI
jgi:hypothetical protein